VASLASISECRNPNHSQFVRDIFGKVMGACCGVDLPALDPINGNDVEIKECHRDSRISFCLSEQDNMSEYVLLFAHGQERAYVVKTSTFKLTVKRKVDLPKVQRLAVKTYITSNQVGITKMKEYIEMLRWGFAN
jgi:hypothetical protein